MIRIKYPECLTKIIRALEDNPEVAAATLCRRLKAEGKEISPKTTQRYVIWVKKQIQRGVDPESAMQRLLDLQNGGTAPAADAASQAEKAYQQKACFEEDPEHGTAQLNCTGPLVHTQEEAIAYSEIDLEVWRPVTCKTNFWTVTMGKDKTSEGAPGRFTNYQISVKFERRAPLVLEDSIKHLTECLKENALVIPPPSAPSAPGEKVMFEMGLYDHHFSLLSWEDETGENWDLGLAEDTYTNAVEDSLARAGDWKVDKILFPVGNDFFHINDPTNLTPMSKNHLDVDGRFIKVFQTGQAALLKAIGMCLKVAPVEIVWVPGNHDPQTSYFLCEIVKATFAGSPHLSVDTGAKPYKFRKYGPALIGLGHGDQVKWDRLPTMMATQAKKLWAQCDYYEWHTGHKHKSKETSFNAGDTFGGVRVKILPSLCAADYYHYKHLFINEPKTCETHVWGVESGPLGMFPTLRRFSSGRKG